MLVQYIAKNSPAALMGLRGGTTNATIGSENVILGGDVILAVQGIPFSVKDYERIQDVVSRVPPGDLIRVKILRAGEQLDLNERKKR